ncbi:MAG: hypothetical protein H0U87_03470 [Acidobacteria bacterium]|jgi:hypothetical protein|nr:hypothetical protein [Acidobacteriota bacterium]
MYCSTCGTFIDSKLSYCQRCGARIAKASAAPTNPTNLQDLTIITGVVGIGGLGITLGLIAVLLNYNVVPQVIVILALAFLCAVFGITFWMTQQTSRIFNAWQPAPENSPESAQINQPNAAQLAEWREPAASVIENTTRTLDKTKV